MSAHYPEWFGSLFLLVDGRRLTDQSRLFLSTRTPLAHTEGIAEIRHSVWRRKIL